ncbi:formate dehydrogenase accessory sulfurtransferase FdhD [Lysobacter sp. A3-1-A15]|uniref:formate dehydrogenase accessory sulfurtransferase FdhD n=1 Tax=Novilysobacter viscosus TaxID=3098602 RepID=UPI002ED8D366
MREPLSEALSQVERLRIDGDADARTDADTVIAETAVALLYNGHPHAVMMATPADLQDFALGFALGEGIVADPGEFNLVDTVRHVDGIALHGAIPQARFDALDTRRRGIAGRSGCGLCGVESIEAAMRPPPLVAATTRFDRRDVSHALDLLSSHQPLNDASGGVHAAGLFDPQSGVLLVREDVGRHNAVDKLVGALAHAGRDASAGFLVITSRASYEIVHKAATSGIGLVVAISAPTDLAIATARSAGLTLAAFARGGALNIYSHPHRVDT